MKTFLALLLMLLGARAAGAVCPAVCVPNSGYPWPTCGCLAASDLNNEFAKVLAMVAPSLTSFGAVCDGVTDDKTAINAALTSGTPIIQFPPKACYSSTSVSIPANVALLGSSDSVGYAVNNSTAPYTLLLGPAATVNMASHSQLQGVRVSPLGIPSPSTIRQAIIAANTFAGTGITINGVTDIVISHVTINGFTTGISHTNSDRVHYSYVNGDDTNGMVVNICGDTCTVENVEFWPFLSSPYALTSQWQSTPISAFTNSGGLVEVTLASTPQYPIVNGDTIVIGNTGVTYQGPNGRWTATAIDSTHFTLQNSSYVGLCPCAATNEIAWLSSTIRHGTAFSFQNTAVTAKGLVEFGHDTALVYGTGTDGMQCIGCWLDSDTGGGTYADTGTVGLQNGAAPGGPAVSATHNAFNGGKIYNKAYAIVENATGTALAVTNVNPIVSDSAATNLNGGGAVVYTGSLMINNSVVDAVNGTGVSFGIYDASTSMDLFNVKSTGTFFYQTSATDCPKVTINGVVCGNLSVTGVFAEPLTTWADTQTCTAGQIAWDASYLYLCTATNTVKRAALSSF